MVSDLHIANFRIILVPVQFSAWLCNEKLTNPLETAPGCAQFQRKSFSRMT